MLSINHDEVSRDENGLALKLGLNIDMTVRSSIDTSCKSSMGTLPKIVNSLSSVNEDMASTAAAATSTKLPVVTLLPQRYTYSNRPLRILVVDDSRLGEVWGFTDTPTDTLPKEVQAAFKVSMTHYYHCY